MFAATLGFRPPNFNPAKQSARELSRAEILSIALDASMRASGAGKQLPEEVIELARRET
jgi:N-acetylglutamate synthase-like GNAT family acetyltransferase